MNNIILNTDSYKTSHWVQYPDGTEGVFSYIEARGGDYDSTMVFGLQIFLKEVLARQVTEMDIEEAEKILTAHGVPFNKEGWEYIVQEHDGYLPLKIKAVPEGTVVPVKNVLLTIENTDPELFWLTSYVETALLRAFWYPTTVATVSWRIKNVIQEFMQDTAGHLNMLDFKLHDFGARGVSSQESAEIGGAAHLVNFSGTDTIVGAMCAMKYYDSEMPGFSIPAAEHSTITSWGRENEVDAFRNMLEQYKSNGVLAVVSDSYDIFHAADQLWGVELKQEVIDSGAMVVIRPDSGDPVQVVAQVLEILAGRFGVTTNDKGYMLLNNVRVIQGDGINELSIRKILDETKRLGYSADNLVFGMGGALLQHMDRDTQQWAMKCSAMKINGEWIDVFKQPITDKGKDSKRGRLTLIKDSKGRYSTIPEGWQGENEVVLQTVFENGKLVNEQTFDEIRKRANSTKGR